MRKILFLLLVMTILFLTSISVFAEVTYSEDIIPKMTSNTAPFGVASASSEYFGDGYGVRAAYRAFDKINSNYLYDAWESNGSALPQWLKYDFGTGNEKVIGKYKISCYITNLSPSGAPKEFIFQGSNDDTNWSNLDTRIDQTNWTQGEAREYTFNNTMAYRYYRLYVTATNNWSYLVIGELQMMEITSPTVINAPTNLSATVGTAKVDLNWSTVQGATSYNVKRAMTAGGPYETISGEVYGTTYVDATVTNNTTYYYIVTAVDSTGESLNSNEVTVMIPNKPVLFISAITDKVKVNDEFTVDVVLGNVTNICAEDIRIKYNTELFEYLGAEPTQGLKVYNESQPSAGILRYIVASLGKDNVVIGEKALVKLKFRAKKLGQDKIDIIRGRIADNGTMEDDVEEANCGEKLITVEGIKDVNRSGEFTLIDLAVDAWYYSDAAANTDTTKYDADLSGDGLINDIDLSAIIQEMLSNTNYIANN